MQIMQYSVWIVGVLVAAWGVAVAIKPQWMKRMMDFFCRWTAVLAGGGGQGGGRYSLSGFCA